MAQDKSSKIKFKKFRFSIVFALVLGLAAAGGYSVMNVLSKSFHKVSDIVDYNRWVKLAGGRPSPENHTRNHAGASVATQASRVSHTTPRQFQTGKNRLTKGRGLGRTKVRDPFHKVHNPMSKKHVQKHRKWSKKLAKIKKGTIQKVHQASLSYRKSRTSGR